MVDITRRKFLAGSLIVGGAAALTLTQGGIGPAKIGQAAEGPKAPELIGTPQDWLNTNGKALKLYGSNGILGEGRICLIDFWEYTCVNCIRTMPYLRAWNDRYKNLGLTIVGIHTPEFDFAKSKENVAAASKQFRLTYPILNDPRYANWEAFDNHYWPRHYLLNSKGVIVQDHAGEGGYGETEEAIQKLLKAANPSVKLPKIMEPVRRSDMPGAVCYPSTPEIYAGSLRGRRQFGSAEGLRVDQDFNYAPPSGTLQNGLFYAKGLWHSYPESLRHARETTDPFEDAIILPYKALEANAVIKPEGGQPFDLTLTQDGKPIPKADKGEDVQYTPDGQSYIQVKEPRMYQLVKNRKWGEHELRLGSNSANFGLYSFTFASCQVGGNS